MDPLTAFVIAALMMLLNGGVLGLVHGDLAEELKPAAVSWRMGTLLIAGGCILLGVQQWGPVVLLLPLANGMLMLGLTGYWLALRQFYGLAGRWWLWLPSAAGVAGIWWYIAVQPDLRMRVLLAAAVWCGVLAAATWTLWTARQRDSARSRVVMAAIFTVVILFMLARAGYFLLNPDAASSVVDPRNWVNLITPLVAATLPVIGTTTFLLLLSERIRRQWETAASIDALTGLPNRRTLMHEGARRLLGGTCGGVLVIDVDHFKRVNDQYGHEAGDRVLRAVADCIASSTPAGGLAARLGGEEFAVLLPAMTAGGCTQAAEQIRAAVAQQRDGTDGAPVTISVGVAPGRGKLDDLLRRADAALYAAKAAGRNRIEVAPER